MVAIGNDVIIGGAGIDVGYGEAAMIALAIRQWPIQQPTTQATIVLRRRRLRHTHLDPGDGSDLFEGGAWHRRDGLQRQHWRG